MVDQNETVAALIYAILKENEALRNVIIIDLLTEGIDMKYIENMIIAAKEIAEHAVSKIGQHNIEKILKHRFGEDYSWD